MDHGVSFGCMEYYLCVMNTLRYSKYKGSSSSAREEVFSGSDR